MATIQPTDITHSIIAQVTESPPADLSARVIQLARAIDHLPPGVYEITIQKEEIRAADWSVEIVRTEKIQNMTLSRYNPE